MAECRCQAGTFELVINIAATFFSAIAQCITVLLIKERHGEKFSVINKFFCVAAVTDKDVDNIFAPENADTAPADGHGVTFVFVSCGNQSPFFSDFGKWVHI